MAKFKTRARTVDMLGRQQIAGIPTAISELFKNAHDAYAKRVEVDYFRSDGLFVLRDDGLGMTLTDFEKRWLTLGTESKLGAKAGLEPPPVDPAQKPRPILGEKGIGRLSIASIGPQVLILTRAKRGNVLHDTVVAFIHWGLFECPGIDLDEIEIPLRTFPKGQLPTETDVRGMLDEVRQNIVMLQGIIGEEQANRFAVDIDRFKVNPIEIDGYLGTPTLSGDGHGTHFIILPSSEILQTDIDGDPATGKATPLQKALLGFTNTMTPGRTEPVIRAAFRDHKTDEISDDLINEGEFFTPEEFLNADHQFNGRFDEFGQFKGTVSIYGEENKDHIVPWEGSSGVRTLCGPFKISFATVQGNARDSTLPLEDHARITAKTWKLGGLYIYKDGIRILPYGDTDYDWLDIEYNRTKSAYYYYFSHRRIFGAVEIDQAHNSALSEKAGREGFRENRAYRQLRSILRNFIGQITADFFREEGTYSSRHKEYKAELNRLDEARKRREQLVSVKRKKLTVDLSDFFSRLGAGKPEQEALHLTETINRELEGASKIADPKAAAEAFLEIESNARRRIADLQERYRIIKPRGLGLGKALQKEWSDYQKAFEDLQVSVFAPAVALVEDVVAAEAKKARLELDRRIRIENVLNDLSAEARKAAKTESAETRQTLTKVEKEVTQATRDSLAEVEIVLKGVFVEFARLNVTEMEDTAVVEARNRLETRITEVKDKEQQFLQYIRSQLEAIDLTENLGQLDQMEALEQRALALEEQADMDLQLTQLGMAVSVIQHEFNASVKTIKQSLQRLAAWADLNQDLKGLYGNLRTSFEHLDGYLTLFTPLERRLKRKKVEIRGAEINKFLNDLFGERLRRHEIDIRPTKAFLKKTVVEYPSSLYPVFVNLIDNALFWLKDQPKPRVVELDADNGTFIISDNGPGVAERDREAIFELGFTRKPGGRGMGLHISREILKRIGYKLTLDDTVSHRGASFRIEPEIENSDG